MIQYFAWKRQNRLFVKKYRGIVSGTFTLCHHKFISKRVKELFSNRHDPLLGDNGWSGEASNSDILHNEVCSNLKKKRTYYLFICYEISYNFITFC